jgi:tetratricopeptide (TPR) repeat protein
MSSSNFKLFLIMLLAAIGLLTIGCTTTGPLPTPPPLPLPCSPSKPDTAVIPEGRGEPEERPGPRAVASLEMTEQGRVLLEQKKVDDAISVLERAVSLNPANGQNYYYLAEAWLLKRNIKQADEFNYLAGIYLEGDQTWMLRVEEQKKRIKNLFLSPQ